MPVSSATSKTAGSNPALSFRGKLANDLIFGDRVPIPITPVTVNVIVAWVRRI